MIGKKKKKKKELVLEEMSNAVGTRAGPHHKKDGAVSVFGKRQSVVALQGCTKGVRACFPASQRPHRSPKARAESGRADCTESQGPTLQPPRRVHQIAERALTLGV